MGVDDSAIVDVAPGLWIWRVRHPYWKPEDDWQPIVTCTVVETGGETAVIDPLIPKDDEDMIFSRLDARPPTMVAILKPDHVRDVDKIVQRYGVPAYGPSLFWRDDIPQSELIAIEPDSNLPGDLLALYDGRCRNETPVYLAEHQTIVFADALTAPQGELRVWWTPWHEKRVVPALREMLELPFERVIVSHGAPLHDRAAFERALQLPPWHG